MTACSIPSAGMPMSRNARLVPRRPANSNRPCAAALAAAGRLPDIAAVVAMGAPFDPEHVTHLFDRSLGRILDEGEACVRLGGKAFTIRREFNGDLPDQDQKRRIAHLIRRGSPPLPALFRACFN